MTMKLLTIYPNEKDKKYFFQPTDQDLKVSLHLSKKERKVLLNGPETATAWLYWKKYNCKGYPVWVQPSVEYYINHKPVIRFLPAVIPEGVVPTGISGIYTVPENEGFLTFWAE